MGYSHGLSAIPGKLLLNTLHTLTWAQPCCHAATGVLLQALIDVAAQGGCLGSALAVMELLQALVQVRALMLHVL